MDIEYKESFEGISQKQSASGKTHSNVFYYGSPMSDGFNAHGFNTAPKPSYQGTSHSERGLTYLLNTNKSRKSWVFNYTAMPKQFIFSQLNTVDASGGLPAFDLGNKTFVEYAGAESEELLESNQFATTDLLSELQSFKWKGLVDTDGEEQSFENNASYARGNLRQIIRWTAEGHLPFILCTDMDSYPDTPSGATDSLESEHLYNWAGNKSPDAFHLVRFKEWPEYNQVTKGFWDVSYELTETW